MERALELSGRSKPDVVVVPAGGDLPLAVNVWVTLATPSRVSGGATITELPQRHAGKADVSIRDDEPLALGLQRISIEQLALARSALQGPDIDEGIHSARKAMKRVRAILRLCRDEIGERVYRSENVILRDAARRMAPVRDAIVVVETVEALARDYREQLSRGTFEELRRELDSRHRLAQARMARDGVLSEVAALLDGATARFASWPTEAGDAWQRRAIRDSFVALAPGLGRTYRRGRNAFRASRVDGSPETHHEWRKRAKYLRHQLETLEPLWPNVIAEMAKSADRLAEMLGSDHDLTVVGSVISGLPGVLSPPERRLLEALALRERRKLRKRAVELGTKVYAEPPRRFVDRLGLYWDAWRAAG